MRLQAHVWGERGGVLQGCKDLEQNQVAVLKQIKYCGHQRKCRKQLLSTRTDTIHGPHGGVRPPHHVMVQNPPKIPV